MTSKSSKPPTMRGKKRGTPAFKSANNKHGSTKRSTCAAPAGNKPVSKLDQIASALKAPNGASLPQLMALTGWQAHSVRGALAGALKKQRGLTIISDKASGERIYRVAAST